jgi:saccharopine dehydrogenase-like NADP-dependent oxidoreductase
MPATMVTPLPPTSTRRSTSARSPPRAATGKTASGGKPRRCREKWTFDFPEIGPKNAYLMYHEELESLVENIKGLKRIRFWMTFSDVPHAPARCLQNVGMTSIEPVDFEGRQIVPLQFLKALLPDPLLAGARGPRARPASATSWKGSRTASPARSTSTTSATTRNATARWAQAISYTTGVPAMIGAMMILTGAWKKAGVFNMEQCDPDPFMEAGVEIICALKGYSMWSTFPLLSKYLKWSHGQLAE